MTAPPLGGRVDGMALPRAFLALIRGINVGGNRIIAKPDLIRCFEEAGCADVLTYIQSGNVLFRSDLPDIGELTRRIEKGISDRVSAETRAVVLPRRDYLAALKAAPPDWGETAGWKHNALFLLPGFDPRPVLDALPPLRPEIETLAVTPRVLFWSASQAHLGRTTMMKIGKSPLYDQVTVRNHHTVFKLVDLFDRM